MLEQVKDITGRAKRLVGVTPQPNAVASLKKLQKALRRETNIRLTDLDKFVDEPEPTRALHLAIDNLVNITSAVSRLHDSCTHIDGDRAVALLNEQISQAETVAHSRMLTRSHEAIDITTRTLNLLFKSKQEIKDAFLLATPIPDGDGQIVIAPERTERSLIRSGVSEMTLRSSLIYELHHQLFPAERMIVGAGRSSDQTISIEAIFDVTGVAGRGGVKADPDKLARALIATSETDCYLALWVHSHPGLGPSMTHPSDIDLRQETEWLKKYSQNLVSAIVVEDRYIRFWGTAIKTGAVQLNVKGSGIKKVSDADNIYRLEV